MKSTFTVVTALLLTHVRALPNQSPTPTPAWQISLYQNSKCTGETTFFFGNGTLPCHDAILNGGALGYIVEINNGSTCSVRLSGDIGCNSTIGVVEAGALVVVGLQLRRDKMERTCRFNGFLFCVELL
ncbi:hypothetical protein BO70DRAFT_79605 [Aspergillus heteromorphus CBS 117.55]|uniref:Cyanovirin-N domain-containing protein n=1 Tax=Aspergillus heteromorphus CBS 117.55 TaxID=1448321 RepID=A0A317WZT3_9EURO|nr:uncharacterized protein BO70DRAFT_79605 [Aspergillus heteromorphus CBS 117.55]PWY90832.1 hypothetical protein BO70DRAFT_79605 [Aspergillus heteromorphus CBS 117.55]